MSLSKTLQRKSTRKEKAPKLVKHEVKDAYILTSDTGDMIQAALSELPHKYSQIGPILQVLKASVRGTIAVDLPVGQTVPTLSVQRPGPQAPAEAPKKPVQRTSAPKKEKEDEK